MDLDILLGDVSHLPWATVGLVAVPVLLVLFGIVTARSDRPDRKLTVLATAIGLAWSAQGMWETARYSYGVPAQLAIVLFVVFEAFMLGRMLNANRYRHDPVRRAKPVRFVWTLALIMGAIVALAEGWHQAPLRFAVPLLVAWNWHLDLTADDDPAQAVRTSWRWTPRRLLLALGALEPGERDAVTIDRERQISRMTTLAYRVRTGSASVNDFLRRPERIAKLALVADDEMVAEMHRRLDRADTVMRRPGAPRSAPSLEVPRRRIVLPEAEPNGTMGVHISPDGGVLRGKELHADGAARVLASVTADRPTGMTNSELAALYRPPLRSRTAEAIGSQARRQINGAAR